MKRILKKIAIIIFIIIAIPLIVALFVSKEFKVSESITINKNSVEVFQYIKFIKNQENYGTWYKMDPNAKQKYSGTDGTVGFVYEWDGETIGTGKQIITKIDENKRIDSDLYFMESKDAAKCYMSVSSQGENKTKVTWAIQGKTPYPFNLLSLFFDMSKDFKEGLKNLKIELEK